MSDAVSTMLAEVWKDLSEQGYAAQAAADGSTLLKVEGGKLVLLHVAKCLGYEVKGNEDGQKEPAAAPSSEPGRTKKAKTRTRK